MGSSNARASTTEPAGTRSRLTRGMSRRSSAAVELPHIHASCTASHHPHQSSRNDAESATMLFNTRHLRSMLRSPYTNFPFRLRSTPYTMITLSLQARIRIAAPTPLHAYASHARASHLAYRQTFELSLACVAHVRSSQSRGPCSVPDSSTVHAHRGCATQRGPATRQHPCPAMHRS